MKFSILVIAMLVASTYAYYDITHASGKELLHILEGGYHTEQGNHRVYVVFFYNPGTANSALQAKNNEYRAALKAQVLDKFPNFYYTEVDSTNAAYVHFSERVVGINTAELVHSPTI